MIIVTQKVFWSFSMKFWEILPIKKFHPLMHCSTVRMQFYLEIVIERCSAIASLKTF